MAVCGAHPRCRCERTRHVFHDCGGEADAFGRAGGAGGISDFGSSRRQPGRRDGQPELRDVDTCEINVGFTHCAD